MPNRAKKFSIVVKAATEHDQQVGRRLKLLRLHHGMTQRDLARHLGVTFQQIQKYETGTSTLSTRNANIIAALFEVSLHSLVGDGRQGNGLIPLLGKDEYEWLRRLRRLEPQLRGAMLRLVGSLGEDE